VVVVVVGYRGQIAWWVMWWLLAPLLAVLALGMILGGGGDPDAAANPMARQRNRSDHAGLWRSAR
jgi:hypothetical protein